MAEVSPLTSVTGLSAEDIEGGDAKEDVLADLYALLGPSVVLVGQNPDSDCTWLELEQGTHYGQLIDLAEEFKAWSLKFNRFDYFGLAQEAYGLLGVTMHAGSHSPVEDAKISIRLFNEWVKPGKGQEGGPSPR